MERAVTKQMEPVKRHIAHDSSLLDGLARIDSSPDQAVSSFLEAFWQEPYDESVLVPLLSLLDRSDHFDDAKSVIEKLKSDPRRYRQFKQALTYNNIASVELQLGLKEKTYWR